MNVNATIFVQIINFLAAYFIIRFLLLKPALIIINSEDKNLNKLKSQVALGQKKLDEHELKKANLQKSDLQKIISLWPDFKQFAQAKVLSISTRPSLSNEVIEQFSQKLSSTIAKRVIDV